MQSKTALEREVILHERHQKMQEVIERYEMHKRNKAKQAALDKSKDDVVFIIIINRSLDPYQTQSAC